MFLVRVEDVVLLNVDGRLHLTQVVLAGETVGLGGLVLDGPSDLSMLLHLLTAHHQQLLPLLERGALLFLFHCHGLALRPAYIYLVLGCGVVDVWKAHFCLLVDGPWTS